MNVLTKNKKYMQFNGTLKLINEKGFTDNEGNAVEFTEAYFQTEDDMGKMQVVKLNTKIDLAKQIDKRGLIKVELMPSGKLRLVEFITE